MPCVWEILTTTRLVPLRSSLALWYTTMVLNPHNCTYLSAPGYEYESVCHICLRLLIYLPRFPTRREVEAANNNRLRSLPSNAVTFESLDIPGRDASGNPTSNEAMNRLLERMVVLQTVQLKVWVACTSLFLIQPLNSFFQ